MKREIGARLRGLREAKGLLQKDVAQVAGVGSNTVTQWEQGNRTPGPLELARLSQGLGFRADFILTGNMDGMPSDLIQKLLPVAA